MHCIYTFPTAASPRRTSFTLLLNFGASSRDAMVIDCGCRNTRHALVTMGEGLLEVQEFGRELVAGNVGSGKVEEEMMDG